MFHWKIVKNSTASHFFFIFQKSVRALFREEVDEDEDADSGWSDAVDSWDSVSCGGFR